MAYEGVIKFSYECPDSHYLIPEMAFKLLNPVRQSLKNKNYLGVYPDGISYGNISLRNGNQNSFFISASDTGKLSLTSIKHYVEVISCNLHKNLCVYKGPGLPSSESLSHFIIYNQCPDINAVIHIHDNSLWKRLYGKVPTSSPDVAYGTVEMVEEIITLLKNSNLIQKKILVMGGHTDGIISFGNTIDEAAEILGFHSGNL